MSIQSTTDKVLSACKSQIHAWVTEGYEHDDIIAQAQHNWPSLTPEAIERIMDSINRLQLDPWRDIRSTHRKRAKQIRMLERRLSSEDAPVSLHSLYRGLLRDHEASSYKLLSIQREQKPLEKKASVIEDAVLPSRVSRKTPLPQSIATTLGLLLGVILTLCLAAGCCSSPSLREINHRLLTQQAAAQFHQQLPTCCYSEVANSYTMLIIPITSCSHGSQTRTFHSLLEMAASHSGFSCHGHDHPGQNPGVGHHHQSDS